MAKKSSGVKPTVEKPERGVHAASTSHRKPAVKRDESRAPQATTRPSALLDTRVIYCGDNLEQLKKLPDACVELARILKKTGCFYCHCALREVHLRSRFRN